MLELKSKNQFSEHFLNKKLNKKALDLACGNGKYSFQLAKNGWYVESVDKNKELQNNFLNHKNINFNLIDLEKDKSFLIKKPFNQKYDLIIVSKYLYRPILETIPKLLKSNGILIYQTFMKGNEKFGPPRNENYLLKKNELKSLINENYKLIMFDQGKRKLDSKVCMIQTLIISSIKK